MLRFGTATADISPEKGIGLAGYPHCPRYNTGVHDPLYASCLFIESGNVSLTLVGLDLLYIGKESVRYIRGRCGGNILLFATHTHSGPWASEVASLEITAEDDYSDEYVDSMREKVIAAIKEARANTFSGSIGTAVTSVGANMGIGGNRRDIGGLCDPALSVLAVRDNDGDIRAVLCNYALHPTLIHQESTLVTADYPAYIRRYFSFAYPKAVTLFAQGTSGNQSTRYHRVAQDYEEASRIGTTLGVEAWHAINKMTFSDSLPLTLCSCEFDLPQKHFPTVAEAEEAVARTKADFEKVKNSGADSLACWNSELKVFGAENTLNFTRLLQKGFVSRELPCELMAAAVGDTAILASQGEIFRSIPTTYSRTRARRSF